MTNDSTSGRLADGDSLDRRVVGLAHELQHVREVAAAGPDADAMAMNKKGRAIDLRRHAQQLIAAGERSHRS